MLSVGRLESVKRVDLLVRAMTAVDAPVRLVVAHDREGPVAMDVLECRLSPDLGDHGTESIELCRLVRHAEQGLGAVLVDEISAAGESRGAEVLHALMQVDNASRAISRRGTSEPFRRYLLYGLPRS